MSLRRFLFIFILLSLCVFNFEIVSASSHRGRVSVVKRAVSRWLCWDKYWGWGGCSLGRVVPAEIKLEKNIFYVWIDNIVVTDKVRMAAFYEGRIRNRQASVILREAFGLSLHREPHSPMKKKKGSFQSGGQAITGPSLLERRKRLFESGSIISTHISIPAYCTPHFEAATPEKELMIATVTRTVKRQLAILAKHSAIIPPHLNMIIANFNVDYPSTYVFVEELNQVYVITLHDVADYGSHAFEKTGYYPFGELYEPSEVLISRIKRNGIVKEINVNLNP